MNCVRRKLGWEYTGRQRDVLVNEYSDSRLRFESPRGGGDLELWFPPTALATPLPWFAVAGFRSPYLARA